MIEDSPVITSRFRRVRAFFDKHIFIPDGPKIGQNIELLPEQVSFLFDIYGNLTPAGRLKVRTAIFSCARKNGKTAFISGILQAHVFGPEAKPNSQVYSAARSRDQASIIYKYAAQSIRLNKRLEGIVQLSDSNKTIHGLLTGAHYKALSSDAQTAYGLNPALIIHDELGQVVGGTDAFFDALETASGAQEEPLSIILSTQAPNDGDLLSTLIDDGLNNPDAAILVHLFTTDPGDDIFDEATWRKANFALGAFRSLEDMRLKAKKARQLPAFENVFRNLYLNQRVSLVSSFLGRNVWEQNSDEAPEEWFYDFPVHLGLDLSTRTDLTAAVLSVRDPVSGKIGMRTFAYTPLNGLEERAKRDRAPYTVWAKQGLLICCPGNVVDYEYVITHLIEVTKGMQLMSISYDRWRISLFMKEAERLAFGDGCEWRPVGQGYKDMSPRLEMFESLALDSKLMHGANPVLTSATMASIAVQDAAGNRKLEKSKSSARIDPTVAAVMSVYGAVAVESEAPTYDISFL